MQFSFDILVNKTSYYRIFLDKYMSYLLLLLLLLLLFVKTLFMKHPRFTLLHTNVYIVQLK